MTVSVGTVYVSSWGYSMTLVDFYKVVKVTLAHIGKRVTAGKAIACPTKARRRIAHSPGASATTAVAVVTMAATMRNHGTASRLTITTWISLCAPQLFLRGSRNRNESSTLRRYPLPIRRATRENAQCRD